MIKLAKAVIFFAAGRRHLNKKDFPRAIALFTKVIMANPKNYAAFNNRGVARQGVGEYLASLEDFNEALKLNSSLAVAYYSRGISWKHIGSFDRALQDQKEALALSPAYGEALGEVAAIQFLKGEYASSIEFCSVSINASSVNPPFNMRALAHFALERYEEAVSDFGKALAVRADPSDMLFLYFARVRSGSPASNEQRNIEEYSKETRWPGPLFRLILGSIGVQGVLDAAPNVLHRAEANFYIGLWHLLQDNRRDAICALEEAVAGCHVSFTEHAMAIAELKRLK